MKKLEEKSQITLIVQSMIVIILFLFVKPFFHILEQTCVLHNRCNLFAINTLIMQII